MIGPWKIGCREEEAYAAGRLAGFQEGLFGANIDADRLARAMSLVFSFYDIEAAREIIAHYDSPDLIERTTGLPCRSSK